MKHATFLIALLIFFILGDCQEGKSPVESTKSDAEVAQEIALVWQDFIDLWEKGDVNGCLKFMTNDYINMPSFESTQDFQETKEMFMNLAENNTVDVIDYKQIEVFVHDNMAYEFGILKQNITPHGEESFNSIARFVTVFQKQEDGSWKFHRWMAQPQINTD